MISELLYRVHHRDSELVPQLRNLLGNRFEIRSLGQHDLHTDYLDSFDWRLARAGHLFAARREENGTRLEWINRSNGQLILAVEAGSIPRHAEDLEPGPLRDMLASLLDVRVLMHAAHLDSQLETLALCNRHGKIVLRMEVGTHQAHDGTGHRQADLGHWIQLRPVRGYDKALAQVTKLLGKLVNCSIAAEDLFSIAAKQLGLRPLDYSSKPSFELHAEQPAWQALAQILKVLQQAMHCNESGMCGDIDPEFLHDFRVAVRRTRSAITDIRDVLPRESLQEFREEFRWLQQVTGPARDLDVYLMGFASYQDDLGEPHGSQLQPFRDFLIQRKARRHLQLTQAICSNRYVRLLQNWAHFIDQIKHHESPAAAFNRPTGQLAGKLIYRAYQRAIDSGSAITQDSPAEDLHDLRKLCKRLRYLLEFFAPIYPATEMEPLIRSLKGLQENLGNFQDFEVQSHALQTFSKEMEAQQLAPPSTYLAMGLLIQRLETHQHAARVEFADRFAQWHTGETRQQFKSLRARFA